MEDSSKDIYTDEKGAYSRRARDARDSWLTTEYNYRDEGRGYCFTLMRPLPILRRNCWFYL